MSTQKDDANSSVYRVRAKANADLLRGVESPPTPSTIKTLRPTRKAARGRRVARLLPMHRSLPEAVVSS